MKSHLLGTRVRIEDPSEQDTGWTGTIVAIGLHRGQVILLVQDLGTNQLVRLSLDECIATAL